MSFTKNRNELGRPPPTKQDQGWAWVVLAAASFNLCVVLGISLGSGVYVVEVSRNWDVNKANAALLGSVLYGIMFCVGPLITFVASKTSNRLMVIVGGILSSTGLLASANVTGIIPLYLTFSVMGGIGNGMVFLQSIVMANLYFKRFRGLASGITLGGGGVGLLIVPLLERKLIAHYSWQPSLYIVAGLCLNTCVMGALMRPVNLPDLDAAVASKQDNVYITPGQELWKNKQFILFCLSSFVWGLAVTVPIILGPDFYVDRNMDGFQINILLPCFGVGNMVGRLVGGVVCNIRSLDKLLCYCIATCVVGVNIVLFPFAPTFPYLAVLSTTFGCTFGLFIVSHTVASATIVEPSKIEMSITVSYFVNGLALVMGPPIAGALFEVTGGYLWPYIASGIAMNVAGLVVIPGVCSKRQQTPQMTMFVEVPTDPRTEKSDLRPRLTHTVQDGALL